MLIQQYMYYPMLIWQLKCSKGALVVSIVVGSCSYITGPFFACRWELVCLKEVSWAMVNN